MKNRTWVGAMCVMAALALSIAGAAAEGKSATDSANRLPKPDGKSVDMTKPVKVFIMAGQSNMEGHARVTTFDYIGDDPATAPLLKQMRSPDGTPRVCDHVWISYFTGKANGEGLGKLTAGFGARGGDPTKDGGKIGPEFTFGLALDDALKQPVLIIKTAWGGKSLNTDFRPPSAGPMDGKTAEETGRYYRLMIEHVRMVLKDIKHVIPDYDAKQGYELGGFVWLQGWNDAVDGKVYPAQKTGNAYAKYGEWLADFIRDVRKDLNAPDMPFVIGVMGIGGMDVKGKGADFREAMAAPAALPELKGRVIAVQTAPFWDERLAAIDAKRGQAKQKRFVLGQQVKKGTLTKEEADKQGEEFEKKLITPEDRALWDRGASNAGYHYLGCAKTFALMGKAFAEALLPLQKP